MFDKYTFMLILLHDYLSFTIYIMYWGQVDRAELYDFDRSLVHVHAGP